MVRQHVNPLSRFYQLERPLPPPSALFANPLRPLELDIGCARGRFLLALAQQQPETNHLGVEIRRPLVDSAEADRLRLGLTNLHYLFCNANISLETWLAALPAGLLKRVTIQFPDPWFKLKHHKRRVLQPALLCSLAAALAPGRELFVQSDVLAVIEPMVALIETSGCFGRPASDTRPWRQDNPLAVASERETLVLRQGLPVYRALFRRNEAPVPSPTALEAGLGATDNPASPPAIEPAAASGTP